MSEKPASKEGEIPLFPGTPWRVHDNSRPAPPDVTPGAGGGPPSDAVVLFDGSAESVANHWESEKGGAAQWLLEGGALVVPGTNPGPGGVRTKRELGDGQYHVEWASPAEVVSQSQGRGNSGVFLLGRYEIQVLDNYRNPTYADGVVGALYGQIPPLVNPIRPPGEWNAYDILWASPRFEGDRVVRPARLTLLFNGVCVHHAVELMGTTSHKKLPAYTPHPPAGPLVLQDHWNPVRFRNIWYRPLGAYDGGHPASPIKSAAG